MIRKYLETSESTLKDGEQMMVITQNGSCNRKYHPGNELGDLGVGWSPNRPTTAIRFSKEHNPVMV